MIIREATSSDVPLLTTLAQKSYTDTFGATMTEDELQNALEERSEKYFYSVLGKDMILIAVDENIIVGFIQFGDVHYDSITPEKNDVELNKIFIDTTYHGKRIGTQLMDAMLAHPHLKDTKNIYLDVYPENTKAIGLYTKYGFQTIGKIPYIANGKVVGHDLLMKLVLKK